MQRAFFVGRLTQNTALELSYSFTEMQLHSIGLRTSATLTQSPIADPTQLNALLAALEAGKRFLDALLTFPVSDYHLISFSEWMRLPYVVITVARLCIPSDAHAAAQWDVKAAQDRVRLDLYLESLCYRMQGLSTYDKIKQPHLDFWHALRMIMDLTRTWFVRKIKPKTTVSTKNTPGGLPTPDTLQSSNQGATEAGPSAAPSADAAVEFPHARLGAMNLDMNMGNGGHDPFAFMRDMDFEMDKFFDMGLWGDESYVGMGFGGGMGF